MNLGVQYYRAPFPNQKFWNDDFAKIKDSGLNTVQLWVLWGWVEPKPGQFIFDDYDQLMELADKHGLGVILSTIAEIQPCWIHDEIPGSEMIDHMGHKVISSNRCEAHFGITPGGCTDNPGVWERMGNFLTQVVTRYKNHPRLRGWDAWNELRWNVQADGFVCYCDHTVKAFHNWLDEKCNGLDGLNRTWQRRYGKWSEVLPGKLPDRPYTEMMAFEHFLTVRANQHGLARYQLMKGLDPNHTVTAHGDAPCALKPGDMEWFDQAINRGNDWFLADELDGVGCSSFPKWQGIDDADFGMRVELVKSAARGKQVWLSEVQGGRSAIGFNIYATVDPASQQRWIWNGLACGADTILFWCWRDEVFGRESAGFGLAGDDGLADQRLAAMKKTGSLLEKHKDLIDNYTPDKPEIGVFFSPQTYYLAWAQDGSAEIAMNSLMGYARSLVRKSIPYTVVEEEHLDALDGLKVLFMPHVLVTDPATEKALARFVENGGTLVCESECGAFDSAGIYRYPAERFTAKLAGVAEVGRRNLVENAVSVGIGGRKLQLAATQWLTPWQKRDGMKIHAENEDGVLISEVPVGKGKLVLCGGYFGNAYRDEFSFDFEDFVEQIVLSTGWRSEIETLTPKPDAENFVYLKSGFANCKRLLFVFFPQNAQKVRLRLRSDFFQADQVGELITGEQVEFQSQGPWKECDVSASEWKLAILAEQ
jgi:beta-galactosidase